MILHNDYMARDFVESGVLVQLKQEFELYFAITDKNFTLDLSPYGKVIGKYTNPSWRERIWEIAFGLKHLADLDPIIHTQKNRLDVFQRGRGPRLKKLVFLIHRMGLSNFFSKIFQKIFLWSSNNFINFPRLPSVALLPTGINDPFWSDALTICKRNKIPSLTLTVNWDNIAHKIFLVQPDLLGVWGEQGYLFARLLQKIPVDKIVNVGTPRFEAYRTVKASRIEARKQVDFPEEKRILLFAGAGVAFDEVSLIEEFEKGCRDGTLPSDLYLVYKPHPKRHKRVAEPPLKPETYKYVQVLQNSGYTPLQQYPILLSAVDGLITPFSTMLLEGALMGLPAIGLAYDDPNHGDFSWSNARMNNHLHPMLDERWMIQCFERKEFIPSILKLLPMIRNPKVTTSAYQTSQFILFNDHQTYADRITQILKQVSSQPYSKKISDELEKQMVEKGQSYVSEPNVPTL